MASNHNPDNARQVTKVTPTSKVSREEGGRVTVTPDPYWHDTNEWISPEWFRGEDPARLSRPRPSPNLYRIIDYPARPEAEEEEENTPEMSPWCECPHTTDDEDENEEDGATALAAQPTEQLGNWTYSSLDSLYEGVDDNTLVPCPNKCKIEVGGEDEVLHIVRKDLEDHLNNRCIKRMFECPDCNVRGPFDIIMNQHESVCEKKMVHCPNQSCNMLVMRGQMKGHIVNDCGYTKLPCEYCNLGCQASVLRKDLDQHNVEARESHLTHALRLLCVREERGLVLKEGEAFTFKITNYTARLMANEPFESRSFYTAKNGYKLDLLVFLNGDSDGNRGYLSVYLRPKMGIFDYILPWPFAGCSQVSILNQTADENHYSQTFRFNEEDSVYAGSVLHSPKFISHDYLVHPPNVFAQYLVDDTIYFRVMVTASHCGQPWLVCS